MCRLEGLLIWYKSWNLRALLRYRRRLQSATRAFGRDATPANKLTCLKRGDASACLVVCTTSAECGDYDICQDGVCAAR